MKENGRIYYGWYIVLTSAIITLLTNGFRLGTGPFVNPVMKDLNMSRTDLSFILASSAIAYGVGMPIAAYLIKKYSTRSVLFSGVFLVCGSILWTIAAKGMLSFLFSFGILLSIGLAFLSPVALTPIVSNWFIRQRGKALFYLTTGAMAGIAIMTPLETILISSIGWKRTLILLAVLFICVVIPSAIFVIKDNVPEGADLGPNVFLDKRSPEINFPDISWKYAIKTLAYWRIILGLFTCGFSMNLLGSHAVPMLIDHHFEPMTASYGVGLIGIVAIFSTILLGSIADRYQRKNILFWIYFVRGFGFLGLVSVSNPMQLYLVAASAGLVWAGSTAMSSAILSDLYGVKLLGLLYGWAYFGHQIGGAIGSFLGGWAYEAFGTHLFAFGLTSILLIIAAWISYRLPTKQHFENN